MFPDYEFGSERAEETQADRVAVFLRSGKNDWVKAPFFCKVKCGGWCKGDCDNCEYCGTTPGKYCDEALNDLRAEDRQPEPAQRSINQFTQ